MSIEAKIKTSFGDFKLDAGLSLPSPGVTGLFGPSGSGKTTILRVIAGLDRYPNCMLKVGNHIWQDETRFVETHNRGIGYVFQDSQLFPHLNVRGNLVYGYARSAKDSSLDESIELLGIERLLERTTGSLSGGEKQRVAIARALAAGPKLLLMDEPFASLDETSKREILPYLEQIIKDVDIPTIYVSHNLEEVARLADQLVLLENGSVTASGPVSEMLTRLDLPLAHGDFAESLIEAVVAGHDVGYGLTVLEIDGGTITVPGTELELGKEVRLRVFARDVSLTLEHQTDTSIQNILPAEVDEISEENNYQVLVRLKIGNAFVLSRITRKSAEELELGAGKQVYVQIKSVVLLV